jgi:hypothetical protein
MRERAGERAALQFYSLLFCLRSAAAACKKSQAAAAALLFRERKLTQRGDFRSSKRGLDFGMSRGFSGSQTAKHLLGLAAASYAGGPGRRKRAAVN